MTRQRVVSDFSTHTTSTVEEDSHMNNSYDEDYHEDREEEMLP